MNHKKTVFYFVIILFLSVISCTKAQPIPVTKGDYYFDNTKFEYLSTYPATIKKVYEIFNKETFKEETFDSGNMQHLGANAYVIKSKNIGFYFWGDTKEDASLYIVELYTPKYESQNAKLIGMTVSSAKKILEKTTTEMKTEKDTFIIFSPDSLFSLQVKTDGNHVISYSINKEL